MMQQPPERGFTAFQIKQCMVRAVSVLRLDACLLVRSRSFSRQLLGGYFPGPGHEGPLPAARALLRSEGL